MSFLTEMGSANTNFFPCLRDEDNRPMWSREAVGHSERHTLKGVCCYPTGGERESKNLTESNLAASPLKAFLVWFQARHSLVSPSNCCHNSRYKVNQRRKNACYFKRLLGQCAP